MKKRLVILLGAIGTLVLLTTSFQRIQHTQQLTVYDAEGKKVGSVGAVEYIYSQALPQVLGKVQDVPFMLYVFRDGFIGVGTVVWESTDCSGTPLITLSTDNPPSSMPRVAIGLPGCTAYVENGPARTVTVGSFSSDAVPGIDKRFPNPSQCIPASVLPVAWTRLVTPARPLIDLNTQFKPPFTVR